MPTDDDIERLLSLFDYEVTGSDHERAFRELTKLGGRVVPRLITALKGGIGRRFGAARTLGEIGINSSCGLCEMDDPTRLVALKAAKVALDWEAENSTSPIEQQICIQLQRAVANLSRASSTA